MKLASTLLISFGLAACTANTPQQAGPTSATADHDCFNVSMVQGFTAVDKDTVRVDLGPGADYDLDIAGGQCQQIDWAQRIALESTTSSFMCVGKQLGQGNIYFRDPATRRRLSCYIEDVRKVAEKPQ